MVYPQVLGNVEGKMLDLLPQTESRNEYVLDFRRMFFLEFLESKNKMLQIGQIQLLLIVHNGNEQLRNKSYLFTLKNGVTILTNRIGLYLL